MPQTTPAEEGGILQLFGERIDWRMEGHGGVEAVLSCDERGREGEFEGVGLEKGVAAVNTQKTLDIRSDSRMVHHPGVQEDVSGQASLLLSEKLHREKFLQDKFAGGGGRSSLHRESKERGDG